MKLNLIQRVTAFSVVVAFVSVLSLIVLGYGYMQLQAAEDSTRLATATSRASVDAARGLGELLLTEGSKSSRELLKKSIDELNSGFVSIGTEGTETASSASKSWLSVKQSLEEMLAQKKPSATNDDSLILYGKLQSGFDELIGLLTKLQAESEESTHRKLVSTFSVLGVAFGAVMLLVIGSGVATRVSLIRSVGGDPTEVVTAVQQVARGNLSDHLSVRTGDTVSVLAETERMQLSLRTIVSDVRMRAEKLAVVSEQTVARATQLSVQSDLVSSELTESTQVVESLGASSASNFGYAKAAQASAQQASVKATQGGHAVARVVKTMENIHITSAKISDIISVIDSIAFQTNILALNAAVEAARAGEQGRGFAVVATEVRSLAQRSAKSAREIKGLIESSVLAVQNGQKEVTEAGASMDEIVTGVAETNSLIEMIFQSVSEQDKALQGLSGSVRNVASMNQENYQAVTEVSQVADKMQHNANRMMELVAHFKT